MRLKTIVALLFCLYGIVTPYNNIERIFDVFPERESDVVDGYVAMSELNQLGRYYMVVANGKIVTVRSVDKLNENHREAHDALWKGTWVADMERELWLSIGAPRKITICKIAKPQHKDQQWYTLKE